MTGSHEQQSGAEHAVRLCLVFVLALAHASVAQAQVPDLSPFPWVLLQGPDGAAWVAAERPTQALYTPTLDYQWNSIGGTNSVLRMGVGDYIVSMPGLGGLGGNVQVTSYGFGAARCKVQGWSGLGKLCIRVRCFLGPSPVDAPFIASFERVSEDSGDLAYAWAPRTPDDIGPTYPAPAIYALRFTHFYRASGFETPRPFQSGLMHVTAYGEESEHCIVTNSHDVACFDAAGNPVRAPYSVSVHDERVANAGHLGAYVSFDFTAGMTAWPGFPGRQWGTSMPARASRLSQGYYRVWLPGMPVGDAAVPLVSGYDITSSGDKSVHCKPLAWFSLEGETVVDVNCYALGGDRDGQPEDAQFNLSYLTNQ